MTAGKAFSQFDADIVLYSAVERQFQIIGEAFAQLARADAKTAELIKVLPDVVAFRNVLVHGYAIVDRIRVWEIVVEDLPSLRKTLDELLGRD